MAQSINLKAAEFFNNSHFALKTSSRLENQFYWFSEYAEKIEKAIGESPFDVVKDVHYSVMSTKVSVQNERFEYFYTELRHDDFAYYVRFNQERGWNIQRLNQGTPEGVVYSQKPVPLMSVDHEKVDGGYIDWSGFTDVTPRQLVVLSLLAAKTDPENNFPLGTSFLDLQDEMFANIPKSLF